MISIELVADSQGSQSMTSSNPRASLQTEEARMTVGFAGLHLPLSLALSCLSM